MKRIRNWAAAALLLMGVFMPPAATSTAKQPANGYPDFAIGCDVSWYNRVEDNGDLTFYKSSTKTTANKTTQKDILYDRGIDAIRLRVWVNPDNSLAKSGFTATLASSQTFVATGGYCDTEDVIAIAKELSANGHRFMIDFHMSDTWADPSKQLVPSAWTSCTSASAVATKIKEHVTEVLTECYNNDINVAWVQIGNETNTGMLLYTPPSASGGTASSFAYAGSIGSSSGACNNFTTYFKAGYDAAKAIYPNCKVIFQHGAGCTSSTVTWCMNCLTSSSSNPNKANFTPDLIGISVYPAPFTTDKGYTSSAWSSYAAEAVTNIENLYINYGYYSMICEFGMPNDWAYETSYSYSTHKEWITHCNTYVKACTQYLLFNSSVQKYCQGMFYWEPLADHYDDYVQAGVYDVDGYNGSDSWARTNVTPNAWWDAVADYTNFPDGDLIDFTLGGSSSGGDDSGETGGSTDDGSLYIVYNTSWDTTDPTEMTYDETTGLYTATIGNSVTDSDYDNTLYFSISTAVSTSSSTTEFEESSLITGSVLVNGQYATLTTGSAGTYTIKLPYGATEWKITVDLTNNRICAYTSDADPNAPSVGTVDASTTWTTVYFYDVTDDTSYEMTTTDGNSYYLNKAIGSSSSTYHNFRFYTGNWESQYSTGDAVSVGTEYSLLSYVSSDTQFPSATKTGWSSWLDGTYLTTSNYIWFNLETLSFKITTSSSSPWTLKEVTSVTYSQYTCSFDNTNTGWDEVYVYALDSDGNEICGVWPGMRLTDPTSGDIWTWSIITSGNAPATVSFSNGYSTDSKTETWAFEEAKVYAGEATETGGDDGGDSGSEGGSTGGLTYDHYYFAGGTHTTYLDNPDEFLYHPTTGLYTATLDCSSSTWVVIFTELASTQTTTWTDVASSSIVPTGSVENGVAQAYTAYTTDMSANSFAVPYAGTWDIILDPTNGTITCYSTDTEPVASVIMQDITNSSSIVANEMTTTDGGTTYCYSGKASSSWMTFNFPINDYAVTYSTGQGVSLNTYYQCYPKGTWTSDYDYPYDDTTASTPTSNTTLTYYDSWNGTSWSTSTTYYFWFNYETKQCYVTTSSSTPTGWATTSTTDYTVTYDNSETGWSTVFAQFYDASGNLVIGALPGVHMTEGTDGKWTVTVALTSAPSTVTFTDGSYVYSSSTAGDTSTFTNNGSYKYTVETEADVAWPELYLYGYAEDYDDEKSPTASQKMVNNGDGTYTFTVTEAMANAYDSGVQFGKITTHDWTAQYGPEILSMDGTAYTDSDNKYNVWLGHKFVLTTGDQDSTIGNLYLTEQPTAESVITFDITSAEAPTLLIGEYSDVDSDSYYLAGYGYYEGTYGEDGYADQRNWTLNDTWKLTYDEENDVYTFNFTDDMVTAYNNYLAYVADGGTDNGFSFGYITNGDWSVKYGAPVIGGSHEHNVWHGEVFQLTVGGNSTEDMSLWLSERPSTDWLITFDPSTSILNISGTAQHDYYICSVPTVDFNAITEATGDVNYGKEMRFCIKESSSYTIEQMHSTDGDVYWISGTTGSTSGYFTTTDVSNAKSYGIFFRYANSSGTYDYYNPDSTIDALDTVYTTTAKENQSSTSSGYTYQKVTTTSFSTNDYVWFRKSTGEFAITTTDVCPFIEYYPMTQDCEAHYATGITTTEGQSFYITDKYDNNYANGDAIPVETLTDMTWGLTESTTGSAVTSDYYWWFNESTKEFIITTSSENPWALPEVTSVHFLNSVEGTTVNDSRKMNYIEEDGSPRYYIELTGRMDHWNSCYFVLNAGESNETRVGNAGLTNGVKTKQNVMTSATKAGWNTSDADGWNTVWYDPTTGEAWMTGAKILYLACEANNWLVDSSSDSGSVRKMAEEEDDDTTDSMDSYRLTYTDESCVDRYFINGVTMDADTPYAIADREWSVRYSTGGEVEANNESNAVSENTDDSALYNMWAPSVGYSNVNMDLVLDPDTPVFTVYTSENQQTGIEGLQGAEADADVMYFNLQGMRIRKPQHGTFYIRVEGKTAEKILY